MTATIVAKKTVVKEPKSQDGRIREQLKTLYNDGRYWSRMDAVERMFTTQQCDERKPFATPELRQQAVDLVGKYITEGRAPDEDWFDSPAQEKWRATNFAAEQTSASKANGHAAKSEPVPGNHKAKGNGKPREKFGDAIVELPLAELLRHSDNRRPRPEDVAERAASMQQHGLLEPILVRPIENADDPAFAKSLGGLKWEVISGETRWLAAEKLGWKTIPARIRDCSQTEALVLVAEANAQRADLNPIERAKLIEALCKPVESAGGGLTKDQAARCVGLKDGSSASNLVRLLKLPTVWQARVAAGELDQSWARLLLPVMGLPPVLAELEKDWATREKKRNEWDENAFDSRSMLEQSIKGIIRDECRPLNEKRWNGRTNATLKIDPKNPKVVKELGIVEVEMPTGKKGQVETVAIATNVKAFDQLLKSEREGNATKEAERSGRDKAKPKREPTAGEKKANAIKQAKQLEHRRSTWRHEWLRSLIAVRIEDQDWQATKLLLWVITHVYAWPVQRGGHWPTMMNEAIKKAGGRGSDWKGLSSLGMTRFSTQAMRNHRSSQRSFDLDEVARDFLRSLISYEERDPHRLMIPHEVVDGVATDYAIDLADEWGRLQETDEGKERLERFFLAHQTQQLGELALELKVYPLTGATRGAIVKLLMSTIAGQTTRRLPLPKCLKPLGVPGKRKAKKGK